MEHHKSTGLSAGTTESVGSKSELLRKKHSEHGMDMNLLATSVAQHKQRLSVKPTYHCIYRTQGWDEKGNPRIHCNKFNKTADPQTCGEQVAGCEG